MLPGSISESAYWLSLVDHQVASNCFCSFAARPVAHVTVRVVVLRARHVGEVEQRADVVDAVVELLRPHARPLDVARALGPAVLVDVEAVVDRVQVALREVVHVVAEAVVAGPAPDQRDDARELDRLVGVEVVRLGARVGVCGLRVVPEVDGAVGDRLVHDDAGAVVEHVGDVAQRAQVVLRGLELAERHRGERGVLAVGREDPRVVREARAEPARALHGAQRCRELLALVRPADLQVRGAQGEVGEVLLAPVDRVLEPAVARQRELRLARELAPRRHLLGEPRPTGRAAPSRTRSARRRGPARSRPPRSTRSARRARGRSRGSAAGRRCRGRTGRRRRRSAPTGRRPGRRARPAARGTRRRSPRPRPRPACGRSRRARRSGARANP